MMAEAKDLHLSVFFHKSDISLTTEQQNGTFGADLLTSSISESYPNIHQRANHRN